MAASAPRSGATTIGPANGAALTWFEPTFGSRLRA